MGNERYEEDLSANLIDPELPPVESSEFTKGEQQPSRCNDAWAALLFYGNVIAIAAVAGALGVPAIQSYNSSNDHSFGKEVVDGGNQNIDYEGIIYGASRTERAEGTRAGNLGYAGQAQLANLTGPTFFGPRECWSRCAFAVTYSDTNSVVLFPPYCFI